MEKLGYGYVWYMSGMETVGIYTDTLRIYWKYSTI